MLTRKGGSFMKSRFKIIAASISLGLLFTVVGQLWAQPAEASWHMQSLLKILQQRNQIVQPSEPSAPTPQTPVTPPTPAPVPETPTAPDTPSPSEPSDPVQLNSEEQLLINLVNQERQKNGLKPLTVHSKLTELARRKSSDMVQNNYFSHTSPTLGSFAQMIHAAGIPYRSAGENLAMARNAQHAFYLLLGSPPHKANMLNANFTHLGIGVVPNNYGVVVTQLFIMQ